MRSLSGNKIRNLLSGFLIAYGGLAFLCFAILLELWMLATPMMPDAVHGYVYAHNEHGRVSYFTAFEATSCALLLATSIPLVFVGAVILPKKNVAVRRGFLGASATWDEDDPKRAQRWGLVAGALAMPIVAFVIGPVLVEWLNAHGVVLSLG
jgi:hypothetical protein